MEEDTTINNSINEDLEYCNYFGLTDIINNFPEELEEIE